MTNEITVRDLNPEKFINEKINEIQTLVGSGTAINALSGGVDSSVVTMLGHKAIGNRLRTVFVENGLMREGEPQRVANTFKELSVQTFYKDVFGRMVRESNAKFLLQGTILTDVDETVAGIKRQHNVFEQLGIDTQEAFGYKIIEPLIQLRKDGVRKVGEATGLPKESFDRIPFPGPALAARIIGEVTREKLDLVRSATVIVEQILEDTGAFQYMAILHEDRVTGMRDGKREFGQQIEIRCWESVDARTATPTRLPFDILERLANEITSNVPGIVSVTYNIATKPPSTIEVI